MKLSRNFILEIFDILNFGFQIPDAYAPGFQTGFLIKSIVQTSRIYTTKLLQQKKRKIATVIHGEEQPPVITWQYTNFDNGSSFLYGKSPEGSGIYIKKAMGTVLQKGPERLY